MSIATSPDLQLDPVDAEMLADDIAELLARYGCADVAGPDVAPELVGFIVRVIANGARADEEAAARNRGDVRSTPNDDRASAEA